MIVELIEYYKYPKKRIDTEIYPYQRDPRLPCDIVVYKDDDTEDVFIAIETKALAKEQEIKTAKKQGLGNCNLLNAKYFLVEADTARYAYDVQTKPSLKALDKFRIADIPIAYDKVPKYRFYRNEKKDLVGYTDFKVLGNKFQNCHDVIWAGGKRDPSTAFDEMSKLMFAKLFDEKNTKNENAYKFQVGTNESHKIVGDRIRDLYKEAKKTDPNVFNKDIELEDDKIYDVVEELEEISLFKTDLDAKGRAFEKFLSEVFRGKLGQYFTRREIVEFIIYMVEPTEDDIILDPSCGSGGFLLYCLKYVNDAIAKDYKGDNNLITRKQYDFSHYNLYGIEINDKIARVAMMDMIVHEDGHTNIEENTAFTNTFKNHEIGFNKFTLILANPPFGNTVKENDKDKLGDNKLKSFNICGTENPKGEKSEILFLERFWHFLDEGGRIGVVLPDGILNNPGGKYQQVRRWIKEHYKINAIISLPEFAFKQSGAGIRTSILIAEKKKNIDTNDDYGVFLAVAHNIGYDAVGNEKPNELNNIVQAYKNDTTPKGLSIVRKKLSELKERLDPRHYDVFISEIILNIKKMDKRNGITVYQLKNLLSNSLVKIQKGKTYNEDYEADVETGVPFLEIKNITEDGIVFGDRVGAMEDKYLSSLWYDQNRDEYVLRKGDILIAITGATIGKTAIVEQEIYDAVFCGDIARIRIDRDKCSPEFVEGFLKTELGQKQVYKWINGATNLHLAADAIGEIYIPVPENFKDLTLDIIKKRHEIKKLKETIKNKNSEETHLFFKILA